MSQDGQPVGLIPGSVMLFWNIFVSTGWTGEPDLEIGPDLSVIPSKSHFYN